MSHEYAMSRVRDALEKSDGNHSKAQRLILAWLEKDQTLLFGLVAPHLQGIIGHAIGHLTQPALLKKPLPKRIEPVGTGEFGSALLESLKGGRAQGVGFGHSEAGLSKPSKASQKHVDAIHKLAAGTATKKVSGKGRRKKD